MIAKRAGIDCKGTIDHRNGYPLDCYRRNLRPATYQQQRRNSRTSLRFKGVGKMPNGRFQASIGIGYTKHTIGTFDTIEQAARAYDKAARKLFGRFACLNFTK